MLAKRNLVYHIIFILLFAVVSGLYYDSVLDKGPLNNHLWRQTDCLSLTERYSEGSNFFKPEMHVQLGDNNTSFYTAGEFPILYYAVGQFWKTFGKSHLSYRLFYLIILFFGVFAFYRTVLLLFEDNFWAIILSFLLFTSPVFAVYGVAFLTDGPAFSFILIALYFFVAYQKKNRIKLFYFSMLFFALAGLIKVSSLIAFVFLICILILESVSSIKTLGNRKLFTNRKLGWSGVIGVLILIFAWYYYASYFNNIHRFKYTFNHIWPLWKMESSEISTLWNGIRDFTSQVFFSRPMLVVLVVFGIFNLFIIKKVPILVYLVNVLIICGAALYFVLWAPLLGNHDYYYVALLILYVGIFGTFFWFLKENKPKLYNGFVLRGIFSLFLVFNFLYCLQVVKLKTLAQEKSDYVFVGNERFIDHMLWTNWDVSANWNRYTFVRPYLDQIGVKKSDRIISFPDMTFNTTLYLTGRKGWTNFRNYQQTEQIEELISKGAKFLILSDSTQMKHDFLRPFLSEEIGQFKGLRIFKL